MLKPTDKTATVSAAVEAVQQLQQHLLLDGVDAAAGGVEGVGDRGLVVDGGGSTPGVAAAAARAEEAHIRQQLCMPSG